MELTGLLKTFMNKKRILMCFFDGLMILQYSNFENILAKKAQHFSFRWKWNEGAEKSENSPGHFQPFNCCFWSFWSQLKTINGDWIGSEKSEVALWGHVSQGNLWLRDRTVSLLPGLWQRGEMNHFTVKMNVKGLPLIQRRINTPFWIFFQLVSAFRSEGSITLIFTDHTSVQTTQRLPDHNIRQPDLKLLSQRGLRNELFLHNTKQWPIMMNKVLNTWVSKFILILWFISYHTITYTHFLSYM